MIKRLDILERLVGWIHYDASKCRHVFTLRDMSTGEAYYTHEVDALFLCDYPNKSLKTLEDIAKKKLSAQWEAQDV